MERVDKPALKMVGEDGKRLCHHGTSAEGCPAWRLDARRG